MVDDEVKIDDGVRIISANNSVVKIGRQSKIMFYSITIGRDVLVGSHSSILPGSIVDDGCIISTHSVVQGKQENMLFLLGFLLG